MTIAHTDELKKTNDQYSYYVFKSGHNNMGNVYILELLYI
jgi:hypothetical protein